jgi:hypothetical protein
MKSKDQLLLEAAYDSIIITELFDTSKKITWKKGSMNDYHARFKGPNGRTYNISLTQAFHMDNDEKVLNIFKKFKGIDAKAAAESISTYHLEFSDTEHGIDISGEGSAAAVFGIVVNAVADLVSFTPRIKTLVLSAKEPSRRSLYSRLLPFLARKLGDWKLLVSKNKEYYYLEKNA